MPKKVFYSFHFKEDFWRVQQIRNIGAIEGNNPIAANKWEEIKKKGDKSIEDWIDKEMKGKSCVIVLVGSNTSNRKWVKKEIKKGWNSGKGLLAIAIDGLKDSSGDSSSRGENPFTKFTVGADKTKLSEVVQFYTPPWFSDSKDVYRWIADNISAWIDHAIRIRKEYNQ